MNAFNPAKFTILIVEDHPFSRKAFIGMLMRSGYENVLSAENGADAIDKLNQHSVDLVITDINMPKVNGLELIQTIRMGSTKSSAHTHIIAVTSLSDTATVSTCMTLEIDSFLVKPITVKNAQDKIKLAISQPRQLYQQHLYSAVNTDVCMTEPTATKKKSQSKTPVCNVSSKFFIARRVEDIKEGMTLVNDLLTVNGGCLLKAGTQINMKLLSRLHELRSCIEMDDVRMRVDAQEAVNQR